MIRYKTEIGFGFLFANTAEMRVISPAGVKARR